jgi:hypothetical protein
MRIDHRRTRMAKGAGIVGYNFSGKKLMECYNIDSLLKKLFKMFVLAAAGLIIIFIGAITILIYA